MVVPRKSVIRGATGDLVYAVNGNAYLLTWVELGAESDNLVEVTKGLLPGDSVVTHGALNLWLIELRALKGGQGCCPAPPKKEKK
jgi:membrane fusion protein (multidrug efflux system)